MLAKASMERVMIVFDYLLCLWRVVLFNRFKLPSKIIFYMILE